MCLCWHGCFDSRKPEAVPAVLSRDLTISVIDPAGTPVPNLDLALTCASGPHQYHIFSGEITYDGGAYRTIIDDCKTVVLGVVEADGFRPYRADPIELSYPTTTTTIAMARVGAGLRQATPASLTLDLSPTAHSSLGWSFERMASVTTDDESLELRLFLETDGRPQLQVEEGLGIRSYSEQVLGTTTNLAAPLVPPTDKYVESIPADSTGAWIRARDGTIYRVVPGGSVKDANSLTWNFSIVERGADGTWAALTP